MNWHLILMLSLLGVVMGFASVFGYIGDLEVVLWLMIAVFAAVWLALRERKKLFLQGFFVGLLAGLASQIVPVILFPIYLRNNPSFVEDFSEAPINARLFMLLMAPVYGLISGLVLGGLTWLARKVVKAGT